MAKPKRTLILLGAGASVEFGIPATAQLTRKIEQAVLSERWVKNQKGDAAFLAIQKRLKRYLKGPVNFEQIYHVAHELLNLEKPESGAVDEYRPLLVPFVMKREKIEPDALRAVTHAMTVAIYNEVVSVCASPQASLTPFSQFLTKLKDDGPVRIYTTNYDDFSLQSDPSLYTGYDLKGQKETEFDVKGFWRRWGDSCVFHLHGSVHMSYSHKLTDRGPFADLVWFHEREEALKSADFHGTGVRRMDGSEVQRAPIITGLDKLTRLQQRPFPYYYSALVRDVMEADAIYVIGAGLSDLHLNAPLDEARSQGNIPPLLFVDWWPGGFNPYASGQRKELEMFHALHIHIGGAGIPRGSTSGDWIISGDRKSAVWGKGFQSFLAEPGQHEQVLSALNFGP